MPITSARDVKDTRDGSTRIADERRRQLDAEGWDKHHDNTHEDGELAMAAVCYAAPKPIFVQATTRGVVTFADPWPWDEDDDKRPYNPTTAAPFDPRKIKPEKRIRLLEKAGALIAAEIDRLLRTQKGTER